MHQLGLCLSNCNSFFLTSDDQLMEDGSNLVNHFWRVLSVNFEREIREATKGNTVRKVT